MLFSGARCNTRMWEPVLPRLAERFHVIRHDVRGTGRSRLRAETALGLDRYADDASLVLDACGRDSCMTWSMAFGSRVALAFASRHPGRASALALFDASAEKPDPAQQKAGAARARQERKRLGIAEITRNRDWFVSDDPDTLAAALAAAYAGGDHARYARGIAVPVLIATGEFDSNLPASRRLQQLIPGSELEVLPATGHGSVLQRPDLCLSVFESFVSRTGSAARARGLGLAGHPARSER